MVMNWCFKLLYVGGLALIGLGLPKVTEMEEGGNGTPQALHQAASHKPGKAADDGKGTGKGSRRDVGKKSTTGTATPVNPNAAVQDALHTVDGRVAHKKGK
jgi:hypothetical protein